LRYAHRNRHLRRQRPDDQRVGLNASIGHGNYNAGFASLKVTNWHGLTFQENFTYSKALGTGAFVQATSQYTANDAFNLDQMYGVQNFDRKFVFNSYLVYEPPFYRSQQGFIGRVLGGCPSRQFSRPAAALRCIATPIPTPVLRFGGW